MKRAASVLLALLVASVLSPTPALAETGDLTCTGNFQFEFDPPLTETTTTSTATVGGGLVNCESPNGNYTRLTSGVRVGEGTVSRPLGTAPCAPVMTISEGARLFWNTDEVSKFDITVNSDPTSGEITISAYFTGGPLKGDTANAYPLLLHPNADCATGGLTSLTSELLQVFWE